MGGGMEAVYDDTNRPTGMAPPFWPLTVKSDEAALTGYGVNRTPW